MSTDSCWVVAGLPVASNKRDKKKTFKQYEEWSMAGKGGKHRKKVLASPEGEDDFLGAGSSKKARGHSRDAERTVPGSRCNVLAAGASKFDNDEEAMLDADGIVLPRSYIRGPSGGLKPRGTSNNGEKEDTRSVPNEVVSSNEKWKEYVTSGLGETGRTHQIKKFVKESLFAHAKFFVQEEELIWSIVPGSIAQYVVQGLHVSDDMETCRLWWHNNNGIVLKELNRKRSDVIAGVKKVFLGKFGVTQRCKALYKNESNYYFRLCCLWQLK
jgi:hypothetical protein